jgi:hypothetical protein
MVTAAAVGRGGARERRRDWRARRWSSADGANDDGNNGNDGDKVNAPVVVRHVAVLLPPHAPPPDGDGNGGGGRRGWREGVSSRLAHAASELGLLHHQDSDNSKNDGDVVM